ncbi:MAG TPA: glycosyltransferase [Candidatus Eisenbacteria bacterium]|nr:glycosyltransferase [Candidatus Eisenbacteria bacterium]
MKRLLVVAYFFPPIGGGGCQRTLKLVRYLEPAGWASTVVTVKDPDYWILDPSLEEEVPASCEIVRVSALTSQRLLKLLGGTGVKLEERQGRRNAAAFRALRRLQQFVAIPDGYRAWARAAEKAAAARIARGGIDALWTTSSPESAHLAGLALKRRATLPWIADFRDPWVGRVTYAPPTAWHDRRHRALEEAVVAAADRVTVVSEAMAVRFRERYPALPADRFVVLPNGYDPDDWARAALLPGADRGSAPGEEATRRFVILHAGQLAHRPTVATLLEAARRLVEESPARRETLRLRFMGGNEGLDAEAIARAGLAPWPGVVETVPSRPHLESLRAMKRANLLVLLGHGGDADSQIYTGKIYEYLTSGRPVLGILDPGPAADLLGRSGQGSACRPGDVEAVLAAIRAPLEAWERGQIPHDFPLPAMAPAWERRTMARRAGELLDLLVSRR